jgi:hypothetical protein
MPPGGRRPRRYVGYGGGPPAPGEAAADAAWRPPSSAVCGIRRRTAGSRRGWQSLRILEQPCPGRTRAVTRDCSNSTAVPPVGPLPSPTSRPAREACRSGRGQPAARQGPVLASRASGAWDKPGERGLDLGQWSAILTAASPSPRPTRDAHAPSDYPPGQDQPVPPDPGGVDRGDGSHRHGAPARGTSDGDPPGAQLPSSRWPQRAGGVHGGMADDFDKPLPDFGEHLR